MKTEISRRKFLQGISGSVAAITFGFTMRLPSANAQSLSEIRPLTGWLRLSADSKVSVLIGQAEIGQGIITGLCQIIASELGAAWEDISFELVSGSPEHIHPLIYSNEQVTGGSASIMAFYEPARKAAAAARMLLLDAAVASGIDQQSLDIQNSQIVNMKGEALTEFGQLLPFVEMSTQYNDPVLRPDEELKYVGVPLKRLDSLDKVTGRTPFGVDTELPDMLYAAVRHTPVFGSTPIRFDAKSIENIAGIEKLVTVNDCVVIVAKTYWAARKASDALNVTFSSSPIDQYDDSKLLEELRTAMSAITPAVAKEQGDVSSVLDPTDSHRSVNAEYFAPHLAHATMEPMSCTAKVDGDTAELWIGTQAPTVAIKAVAEHLDIPKDNIKLHLLLAGGGFGRRGTPDYAVQAAAASKAVKRPVKLIWSREEDIRADSLRPPMLARMKATLDNKGNILAWHHRNAGPGVWKFARPELVPGTLDHLAIEGSTDSNYNMPNFLMDYCMTEPIAKLGFWRSVGYSHNIFFVESFLDEIAAEAGKDPFVLRQDLLKDFPAGLAVLNKAAELAGWNDDRTKGRALGLAFYRSPRWQSPVCQVAEVSVEKQSQIKVHRITTVIDCGIAINPELVKQQMEGSTIFGLTAALYGRISFKGGRVQESNYHDYPMIKLSDTPQLDVHILQSKSFIGGVGELGTPAVAPAIANAVFRLTGERLRELPLQLA